MLYVVMLALIGPVTAEDTQIDKVESEARRYRIHLYETYREDREEYDRRIAAGEELLEQWRANQHPADNVEQLQAWFEAARALEVADSLPARPEITQYIETEFASAPAATALPADNSFPGSEQPSGVGDGPGETPFFDPTLGNNDQVTITRTEVEDELSLEQPQSSAEQDADNQDLDNLDSETGFEETGFEEFGVDGDLPTWAPAPWRSLGNAVWNGVEDSLEVD